MRQTVRPLVATATCLLSAVTAVGCSGPRVTPAAATRPLETPATSQPSTGEAGNPVGMVALGHSGMTGRNSDPASPGEDVGANSWATGTNLAVDSVYLRLVRALPQTEGHVLNLSRDGATADLLEYQAADVLRRVPVPRLAVVQIMDNDIRCDGTDPDHYAEFRTSVRAAVMVLTKASPKVTVVLVSGPGRPTTYAAAIATLPTTPKDLVGQGPCVLFSANRVVNTAEVARLTKLMKAYEAELARACEGIPQCHTDGGALARYRDTLADYSEVDREHPSVVGHAHTAAAVWPSIAAALGIK